MSGPTARQLEVLGIVARLTRERGLPPTLEEVGKELGVTKAGVLHTVRRLRRQGLMLPHDGNRSLLLSPAVLLRIPELGPKKPWKQGDPVHPIPLVEFPK